MNTLHKLLTECELDADALIDKLRRAAVIAQVRDSHAKRRLEDMADWLTDVAEELAALAGHPRDVPDYYEETRR